MANFPLTWVLVADSARARIFAWPQANAELDEIQAYSNSEARLPNSELSSDEQGRAFDSGGHGGAHPMGQKQSPREKASDGFAKEIAAALKQSSHARDFERLILIAPAAFLGKVRASLDKATEKKVKFTLTNDLTQASAADITAHLPEPWQIK